MNIGSKISDLRKEKGLSREAIGKIGRYFGRCNR
jgi:hypothetical protein